MVLNPVRVVLSPLVELDAVRFFVAATVSVLSAVSVLEPFAAEFLGFFRVG